MLPTFTSWKTIRLPKLSPTADGFGLNLEIALGWMSFRSIVNTNEGDQTSKVIAYSYDAAGRLLGSQHGDHAHRYSVDAAGNRLEGQQALPDNRLGQLNGTRYRYDGVNRLVHLIHASELGASREATYRYDGLGRRISKTLLYPNGTTATTHYGWDGDRIVHEETDNQRTTVVYEPGSFVPMLRIDDTQQGQILRVYVTDALGPPMQIGHSLQPAPLARRTRRLGGSQKLAHRAQRHPTDPLPGAEAR